MKREQFEKLKKAVKDNRDKKSYSGFLCVGKGGTPFLTDVFSIPMEKLFNSRGLMPDNLGDCKYLLYYIREDYFNQLEKEFNKFQVQCPKHGLVEAKCFRVCAVLELECGCRVKAVSGTWRWETEDAT